MKKVLLTISALFALVGGASAADLPSRKAAPAYVPPPPPPMWTGFYAGLNLGGGWGAGGGNSNVWNLNGWNGGVSNNLSGGVLGGAQVGYNYQFGQSFVLGAEADFQGTSMGSGGTNNNNWFLGNGWGVNQRTSLPWFGTVRGRVGLTIMPTLLLYGTGGFAYGEVQRNGGVWGWNNNTATQTGWTAGGGAEWMFLPNWSAKAEYLYSDISGGNQNTWFNLGSGLNNVNNHTRWNTIRAGVNYHFNWGANPGVVSY
jgi:outer membrane immunogenic protein